jgi:DNA-binding response OmpR family regulator
MIISARDEESNIVKALNLAPMNIFKTFRQLELVARIKAMNRRIVKKDQDKSSVFVLLV